MAHSTQRRVGVAQAGPGSHDSAAHLVVQVVAHVVGAWVTGVFFIASPFLEDHETAIAVVLWLLIVPTGVFSLVASWFVTRKLIRTTLPRLRLANRLRRGEAKLRSWRQETSPDGALVFTLEPARGSGRWPSPDPRLIAYLEQVHPRSAPE